MALALVAILLALALPAYRETVIRANRVIGKAVLQEVAMRQERLLVEQRRYGLNLPELGLAENYYIDAGANPVGPVRAVYKIELVVDGQAYLAVMARPVNLQVQDRECGAFTLGRQGQRSVSGALAAEPHRCW